jgi:sugar/nucleoside kinase (ribokinase family)
VAGLLVCIGDLVEDVVVWAHGPLATATDNPSTISRTRGGSAANVAVFAAPLVPVRFIGRVGADPLGQALVQTLSFAGVEPRVQRIGVTGSIVILVDAIGERTMYPDRAASAQLADVPLDWVDGAAIVHAPAYCFATEVSRATTLQLLRAARSAGATISVDAASVSLLEAGEVVSALAAVRAELIFANAAEAAVLERAGVDTRQATVIVKAGADPVRLYRPGGEIVTVPVPPVPGVRDTIGAGDAFAAGFLAATLQGLDPRAAVTGGIRLAASVLGAAGAVSERSTTA